MLGNERGNGIDEIANSNRERDLVGGVDGTRTRGLRAVLGVSPEWWRDVAAQIDPRLQKVNLACENIGGR